MALSFNTLFSSPGSSPQGDVAPPSPPPEVRPGSFIGPGVRLVGSLRSAGTLTIQGRVEGPVAGGEVVVDRGGCVEGEIRAATIWVRGRTHGALLGEGQVRLEAGAEHHGAVRTPSLIVEAGALMDGEVKVGREDPPAPSA